MNKLNERLNVSQLAKSLNAWVVFKFLVKRKKLKLKLSNCASCITSHEHQHRMLLLKQSGKCTIKDIYNQNKMAIKWLYPITTRHVLIIKAYDIITI